MECETPEYQGNRSLTKKVSETVNVYFDDLAVPVTIDYVCDPSFEQFKDVVEYEKGASIEIKVYTSVSSKIKNFCSVDRKEGL